MFGTCGYDLMRMILDIKGLMEGLSEEREGEDATYLDFVVDGSSRISSSLSGRDGTHCHLLRLLLILR